MDAPDSVFMRGSGGTIFKMDVPTSGMAKERWDEAIAKGDLIPVDNAIEVEHADGTKHWEVPDAPEPKPTEPKQPATRRTRGAKADAAKPQPATVVEPPAAAEVSPLTEERFDQLVDELALAAGDVVIVHTVDKHIIGRLAAGPAGSIGLDQPSVFDSDEAYASSLESEEFVGCQLLEEASIELPLDEIFSIEHWNSPYDPTATA